MAVALVTLVAASSMCAMVSSSAPVGHGAISSNRVEHDLRRDEDGKARWWQRSLAGTNTDVDKKSLLPRIATYRNGYGTHFTCTTTCYFILLAYVITLASFLAILFLIPVQSSSKTDKLPFRLWFGDEDGGDRRKLPTDQDPDKQQQDDLLTAQARDTTALPRASFWSTWAEWFSIRKSWKQRQSPTDYHDSSAARLLRGQAGRTFESQRTYESIGVDTDDLLGSTGPSSPTKRGSIFASAPSPKKPVRPRVVRTTSTDILGGGGGVSFVGSETSFFSDVTATSRLDTTKGLADLTASPTAVEKKEIMVRDIERRASIQHRAEKRKEQAKSDISYENLRDEEIQTYEYLEFVRELLGGMAIKKLCQKSAKVVKRTFYINPDMSTVYWNKIGTKKWVNKKSSLDASKINKVLKGFHGNANVEAKGKPEKSMLYVSVVCTDGKRLDLEAKDEAMRQRLYIGFSRLSMEKRQEQQQQPQPPPLSQQQVPHAATSSMAGTRLPPVMHSDDDDEEEEKPHPLGHTDPALHPEEGHFHPEDTRAHPAAEVGVKHPHQQQQQQQQSITTPAPHRRVSTAAFGVLHSSPSSNDDAKNDEPETETVSLDVLRELSSEILEEKEEDTKETE